jgi:hypothetical protein
MEGEKEVEVWREKGEVMRGEREREREGGREE